MADEIVLYLVDTYSVAQIRAARAKCAEIAISENMEPTVISGVSNDGSSMSMARITGPADRQRFMAQCRAAIAMLNGDALPGGPGIKLDFSTRMAST